MYIMSGGLVRQFSGRKRGSGVWQYFSYDAQQRRSRCTVSTPTGSLCNMYVATKNPTNLKNHLQTHHKNIYDDVTGMDERERSACKARKVEGRLRTFLCFLRVTC